jgi:hypothetical protein
MLPKSQRDSNLGEGKYVTTDYNGKILRMVY